MRFLSAITMAVVLLLAGCATNTDQYYWGSYEELIYQMYANPGEATPEVQIQKLTSDIQKAESSGKPVPPGVHAHLGMMFAAAGNLEQALGAFATEKANYPESAKFIDDVIERATRADKDEI